MGIDLFILCLTLFFAFWGAMLGASRQLAQAIALFIAYLLARPLGVAMGPKVAEMLGGAPRLFGTIVATMIGFIVLMIVVRFILTRVLQKMLEGRDPQDRRVDRALGFLLGGGKVLAIAYVMVSGLVFAEENVSIAGKRLGLSPRDSYAFLLAKNYNLFEYTEFGGVKNLVALSHALSDPERAAKLQSDPAFLALKKDPRFKSALNDAAMRKALESGDTRALLRSNAVLQLIQDQAAMARVNAALNQADHE